MQSCSLWGMGLAGMWEGGTCSPGQQKPNSSPSPSCRAGVGKDPLLGEQYLKIRESKAWEMRRTFLRLHVHMERGFSPCDQPETNSSLSETERDQKMCGTKQRAVLSWPRQADYSGCHSSTLIVKQRWLVKFPAQNWEVSLTSKVTSNAGCTWCICQ